MTSTEAVSGRSAVVTGGNKGIGAAIVQALLADGHRVASFSRGGDAPEGALGIACDVTDGAQVDAAFKAAEEAHGPTEILVANSGVTKDTLILRMKAEEHRLLVDRADSAVTSRRNALLIVGLGCFSSIALIGFAGLLIRMDLSRRRAAESELKAAEERSVDRPGATVNIAVGYGGRQEIADAVRSLLLEHASRGTTIEELAEVLDIDHIAEHLYTRGQPDPDLVIRTSGEQRLSGFLLWQSVHSEFYFCDAYWPDFRRVDFLRALRDYAARNRRFGT